MFLYWDTVSFPQKHLILEIQYSGKKKNQNKPKVLKLVNGATVMTNSRALWLGTNILFLSVQYGHKVQ